MTDKILCIGGPLSGRTVSKKTDFSHSVPHYDRTVIPSKGPAQKMRIEQVRYVLRYWSFEDDPVVPFFAPEAQTHAETFRLLMLGFQHAQRSDRPDWDEITHRNNTEAQQVLQEILSAETPAHVTASKAAQLLANGYSLTGLGLTRDGRKCTIDCGKVAWMERDEQSHAAR